MSYHSYMYISIDSFADELEKIAATVNELLGGVRRMGGIIRIPVSRLKNNTRLPTGPSSINVDTASLNNILPRTSKKRFLLFKNPNYVQKQKAIEEVRRDPLAKALHGKITIPKGGSDKVVSDIAGVSAKTPEGKKAVNVATLLHEGFERSTKPHLAKQFASHRSPEVILKEHNMLAKMTGEGSDEARKVFQALRSTNKGAQEGKYLRRQFVRLYGPRARFQFGEGQRIPKAMIKDFARRYAADPNKLRHPSKIKPTISDKVRDFFGGVDYNSVHKSFSQY